MRIAVPDGERTRFEIATRLATEPHEVVYGPTNYDFRLEG
jgi:hypothetical protein